MQTKPHRILLTAKTQSHDFSLLGRGSVMSSWAGIDLNQIKWAAGGGLRFNLNPGDTTNLRIDFAAGPNTTGLYLTIGEAF